MPVPRSAALIAFCTLTIVAAWSSAPLFETVRDGAPVEDRGRSRGAAWGDFDGDGDPDLFVTRPTWDGETQVNVLYVNQGDGFVRVPVGARGPLGGTDDAVGSGAWEGAVWVDPDGDGDLDLHVVGRDGSGSMVFENRGGGDLARRPTDPFGGRIASASMACWADVDADGLLDVFVVGHGEGGNLLFRNLGSWRFEAIPLAPRAAGDGSGRACAWGDLDGDGLPELVIANARQPNLLVRNRDGMALVPDTTTALHEDAHYGYGVSWTDVNGDGNRDLFVANFDADNALYLGDGRGGLDPVPLGETLQSAATKGHVWGDFDLDGHIDAYLGSGTPRPGMVNRLYLQDDGGEFRLSTGGESTTHADTSAAVATADYDRDGDLDLFVGNWGSLGSRNRLYRNTTTGRSWLTVRLEGSRSNRMGVGARGTVVLSMDGGARRLHRWMDAATGYAGQNEPVLHFGLGTADRVDSLIIAWPSGTVDRLGPVRARSTVTVREGVGLLTP